MASPTRIDQLSLQVVTRILSFLNLDQRKEAARTCKKFYEASCVPQFSAATSIRVRGKSIPVKEEMIRLKRVPNLTVKFQKNDDSIVPRLAKHLGSTVTALSMTGKFSATTMILVRQNFKKLVTLHIQLESLGSLEDFFGDGIENVEKLRVAMQGFPNVVFLVPDLFLGMLVLLVIKCLSGVQKLSLTSKCTPREEHIDELPFLPGAQLIQHLARSPELGQGLQELNLTWVTTTHKELKQILSRVNPGLKSLSFLSSDGVNRSLRYLAATKLPLEYLKVVCQRQERFAVRFPAISVLLERKSQLKSFTCQPILYRAADDANPLTEMMGEWPGIHDLSIKGRLDGSECEETEMVYTVKDGVRSLEVTTKARLGNQALLKLAEKSPHLEIYAVDPCTHAIDATGLGMLANTFVSLRELQLGHSGEGSLNIGILSASPGGSKLANLQVLSLAYCQAKTEEGLKTLSLPHLKHLWLPSIYTPGVSLSNDVVMAVASNNPSLEMLDIGASRVTDVGIASIVSSLEHLRCLLIAECPMITARSARVITRDCFWLEFVDVTGCKKRFITAMRKGLQSMPHLQTVLQAHEWQDFMMLSFVKNRWEFAVRHLRRQASLRQFLFKDICIL